MPKLYRKWKRARKSTNLTGEDAASLPALESEGGEKISVATNRNLDDYFLTAQRDGSQQVSDVELDSIKTEVNRLVEEMG